MEANELLREIRLKIARGDFNAARAALLGSSSLAESAEAQAMGARLLGYTDGYALANSMFLDLEAVWPDNFEVLKMHCQLMQEHGDYNEAISLARRILDRFPTRPDAYEMLIDNYELAGRHSEALQINAEALAGFPGQAGFLERQNRLSQLLNRIEISDSNIEEIRNELSCQPLLPDDENIMLLLKTFKSRTGVHAVQTKMGKSWGYIPERRDMTTEDLKMHLGGRKTLGVYVTDINNTSRLMVMDLDIRKPWMNAYANSPEERKRINRLIKDSADELVSLCSMAGLSPLVECSGNKGLHFWFFADEDFACRYWRSLGSWLLGKLRKIPEELSWEIFPKQDRVPEDGLGNLVKLPLGTHQKTGRRSYFIDSASLQPFPDQMQILRDAVRIDRKLLEQVLGAITIDNCRTGDLPAAKETGLEALAKSVSGDAAQAAFEVPPERNLAIGVRIPLPERHTMEVEQVLSGCRPMWNILEKARHERSLTADEKHAFVYIFAHLGEEGRIFIHQVMNQLEDYQPDAVNALIKAVPPNAPGCGRIRKRIPDHCGLAECNCQFRLPEGCYASPVIHAGLFPGSALAAAGRKAASQPANLSGKEMIGGESGCIDRMMQEYVGLSEEISRLRERAALLRRQINRAFDEAGSDSIETRIRVYHRLPDEDEPVRLLAGNG